MTVELWATVPTMDGPIFLATFTDPAQADLAAKDGKQLYPERTYEIRPVAEKADEARHEARLAMLRSLDPVEAKAFYDANDAQNPHIRRHNDAKVMVRVHKDRIACAELTDEERQVSRDWIAARIAQGR